MGTRVLLLHIIYRHEFKIIYYEISIALFYLIEVVNNVVGTKLNSLVI